MITGGFDYREINKEINEDISSLINWEYLL